MIDSLRSGELTVAYFVAFKVASSRQESQSMTHLDRSDINKDAQTLRIAYNSCLKKPQIIGNCHTGNFHVQEELGFQLRSRNNKHIQSLICATVLNYKVISCSHNRIFCIRHIVLE